jgi:transposase
MIISITNYVIDMSMTIKLITDTLYQKAVRALSETKEINRISIRLKAIIAAKEHGVNLVSKIFNITSNTLRNWVKNFSEGGEEALMYQKGRGRKSKILDEHRSAILGWVQEDCNLTIYKILFLLDKQFGLQSSKSAVHRVLLDLNLSYITPRPQHYKQDPALKDEFKKKSK